MSIPGMDSVPNTAKVGEGAQEINKTRQYIADRTSAVTPIAKGGTGATDAATARANLGAPTDGTGSQLRFTSPSFGWLSFEIPGQAFPTTLASQVGLEGVSNQVAGKVNRSGDNIAGDLGIAGQLFIPNAYPTNIGPWTALWLNGDGRISKGTSARRFKTDIENVDPAQLRDLFPQLVTYFHHGDPDNRHWGYIADDMQETELAPLVLYSDDGQVEAYEIFQLMLLQIANLNARVTELEGKTDA